MKKISVAFASSGGMGNLIIHANFAKAFRKRFTMYDFELVFFGHPFEEINEGIFYGQDWIDTVYTHSAMERKLSYNAFINLHFYPQIWILDEALSEMFPEMYKLFMIWKKEIRDNRQKNYLYEKPNYNINAIWEGINRNKTCLNSCDITGELGIGKEFGLEIYTKKNSLSVLHNFGLANRKYITLQRGNNQFAIVKETPKLWPLDYYNSLIDLLKKEYPNVAIVQVGGSRTRSDIMGGTDLDLVGKTDLEDLKILLKHAWLHVDAECGMVHMRKALRGGPSVVMYGQTPREFYAYEGNINLSTDVCPVPCARLTDDWQWRCARGDERPACMYSITPQIAFEAIQRYAETGNVKEKTNTLYDQMLADERFHLDQEWANRWLKKQKLLYYDVYEMPLKDILTQVYIEPQGFARLPLDCSPVYQQLVREDQTYKQYLEMLDANKIFNEHSVEGFLKINDKFNSGYDYKYMPVIDGRYNEILDGQHRLAWLLFKYGINFIIKIIKLWWA